MNGHAATEHKPPAATPAQAHAHEEKLPSYREERDSRGSFTMDMKGPIRPLDLGDDEEDAKRTPAQRRLLLALGLLVLLVLALVVCLVVVVIRLEDIEAEVENICETEECIRSADNLIQSMDPNADPCTDFYRFACGRWPEDHPLPDAAYSNDWFAETSTLVNQQIQDLLETNETEEQPWPVNQARRLYQACMDTELLDEQGLEPLLAVLTRLELGPPPAAAPAPASASEPAASASAPDGWKLERALAAAQLTLGLDVLVGVGVWPAPTNRTHNRITVATPSSTPVLPGYPEVLSREPNPGPGSGRGLPGAQNARSPERLQRSGPAGEAGGRGRRHAGANVDSVEEQYIARVLELTARWYLRGEDGDPAEAAAAGSHQPHVLAIARSLAHLERSLEKIQEGNQSSKLTGVEPELMSVAQLQQELDRAANGTFRLNLTEYLELLFEGSAVLRLGPGPDQDMLQVYDLKYLRALAALLAPLTDRELSNYVWWKVASSLAPYTDSEMRILKERYLEDATESYSPESRPHFCASLVNQMMGMAVAYFFYDPAELNVTRDKMRTMFEDIRWAFDERVEELDWMDAATKASTREKASAMDFLVGFPDWLGDAQALDEYYLGVDVEQDALLESLLSLTGLGMNSTLRSLRETNDRSGSWEIGPPMETNAAHIPYFNTVVVQAGILQFPFFLLGVEALNYGAIGSIIGHELTHGFDDQGRKYDPEGNLRQWWSNATVSEYENRTQCFVDQYGTYHLKEISEPVDGQQTLGENIADNGGLREALRAYRRLRARRASSPEPTLPGLERFSGEQLFFLSFANVWCEKWTKQSLRNDLLDEHSPSPVRVRGALANSPEFAEVWHCPRGSRMNPPRERCMLW